MKVNHIYIPYLNNTARYLILFGSAGSGKSHFTAQKIILRLLTEPKHRFLCIRKVANTLRSSVYQLILDTIHDLGIYNEFDVNKTEMRFTHRITHNEILLAGLDDVEKLKSIAGITGVWIEEATELIDSDFDQLDIRLRGETINYKQIILTFNPVNEKNWIKKRFFDNEVLNCTILKTTFKDNAFIDSEYKQVLEQKASISPNFYRIYYLGEWGKPEVQRPYVSNFSYTKHVSSDIYFNNNKPLYFSIDFNKEPFVCLVIQIWNDSKGEHIHFIKEIVLDNGDIDEMARKINTLFPPMSLSSALWTGDATGNKRDVVMKNNMTAWKLLMTAMEIPAKRINTPRSNPNVSDNRFFIEYMFAQHPDLKIAPEMSLLINELQFTEADSEGNIIKKDRNKDEQRADALDCLRYALNTWCRGYFTKVGQSLRK